MEQNMTPLISNESEPISRVLEFLTYSGVDAVKEYDEESDLYQIFVPKEQYDRASALLTIFMDQEPSDEDEEQEAEPSAAYVGSGEKYEEKLLLRLLVPGGGRPCGSVSCAVHPPGDSHPPHLGQPARYVYRPVGDHRRLFLPSASCLL